MIVSFFESIKYVGHLYPVAFLRIFVGYHFFQSAYDKMSGNFLIEPRLAGMVSEWIPNADLPGWYLGLLEGLVIPKWQIFAYLLTYCEFVIGLSLILGFLVRPVILLGVFVSLNYVYGLGADFSIHQVYIAIFVALGWIGAGRSLGLDYFFYKRQRGVWW